MFVSLFTVSPISKHNGAKHIRHLNKVIIIIIYYYYGA